MTDFKGIKIEDEEELNNSIFCLKEFESIKTMEEDDELND
jgi:hypothetical protein